MTHIPSILACSATASHISCVLCRSKVHFHTFTNPLKLPVLSQMNFSQLPASTANSFLEHTFHFHTHTHNWFFQLGSLFHIRRQYMYDLSIDLMRATRFIRYILLHSIIRISFDEENFEIPYYILFIDHHVTSSYLCPNIILLSSYQNLVF